MTMFIPMLYHWTPTERRRDIQQNGLKVYSKPVVHSDKTLRSPYICLGFTPSGAWGLSGDFYNDMLRNVADPVETWDLWQVTIPDMAEVRIRSEFGPTVQEVKVYTSIPASEMWYVATRFAPCFES